MYKYVYLVVTVNTGKYHSHMETRMLTREPKLKQNEFSYRLKIELDETKWKKRMIEANLPQ